MLDANRYLPRYAILEIHGTHLSSAMDLFEKTHSKFNRTKARDPVVPVIWLREHIVIPLAAVLGNCGPVVLPDLDHVPKGGRSRVKGMPADAFHIEHMRRIVLGEDAFHRLTGALTTRDEAARILREMHYTGGENAPLRETVAIYTEVGRYLQQVDIQHERDRKNTIPGPRRNDPVHQSRNRREHRPE